MKLSIVLALLCASLSVAAVYQTLNVLQLRAELDKEMFVSSIERAICRKALEAKKLPVY